MWSLEFGGIERLVLDLCKEQRKNGMDAKVLVGRGKGRLANQFALANILVIDANLKSGFDTGRECKENVMSEMNKTDIIHIHSFSPTFANMAKKTNKPIIFTDHGNYGLGRKRTWRDHTKFFLQSKFFKKHVSFITFNSLYTKGLAQKNFPVSHIPSQVVYNGINLEKYNTKLVKPEIDIPDHLRGKFMIGTTSRFAGFKRVDRLIEAFAKMDNRDDGCLLLVGDGSLRASYETLVKSLGIEKQTYFSGFQPEVRDYQMAMDVCVFPSAGEPFGLVAVETLALGQPTIVMRDGGGIVEIIEPIDPENIAEDVSDLSRILSEQYFLWKRGALVDSHQIQERRKHANKFCVSRMADEFASVYTQCLSNNKSGVLQ